MPRTCKLELFTWTVRIPDTGHKDEIVPICPTHASLRVRFGSFGNGVIVTCHEGRNHLVKLCERDQFEAEQQEAARILLEPVQGSE